MSDVPPPSASPSPPDDAAELARLRSQVAELSRPHRKVRSVFAGILLALVLILTPLAIVASWASSILGDTNRYVATVAPLVSEPAVQTAIADRAGEAVQQHLDVKSLLQQVAPADRPKLDLLLGTLSGPLENALSSFVSKQTQAVVASDWFQTFWTEANRRIHTTMVKALTGKGGGAVQLTNNSVVIDLAPVIDQVKQRLVNQGLTVANKIPEIHTSFTVVDAQNIGKAKTGFRLLQIVGNWMGVFVVLLAALAIWLARRRRRALTTAAFLIAAGALLLGLALVITRAIYLDKLPASVSQDAAAAIFDDMVRFIRTALRSVAVLGIAVGLGAWLSGPGRRASQVHGLATAGIDATRTAAERAGMRLGPVGPFVHRYKKWFVWGVLAAFGLSLAFWSYPTGLVVTGLVLAALFALAVVEFLDNAGKGGGAVGAPPTGPGTGGGTGAGTVGPKPA